MIRHYLKIAFKNLFRQKTYSIINISGLAIGLAMVIMIALYVRHDLNFDRFHSKKQQIYRVLSNRIVGDETLIAARNPMPIAPVLKEEFPEIIESSRYDHIGSWFEVRIDDQVYKNDFAAVGDGSLFNIFDFEVVAGDPVDALKDPNSIVVVSSLAKKYFNRTNVIGEVLNVRNKDFKIAAVIIDPPNNSHIRFDYMLSYEYWFTTGMPRERWKMPGPGTTAYILLNEDVDVEKLNTKIFNVVNHHDSTAKMSLFIEPMLKMHLHSEVSNDFANAGRGDINTIILYISMGFFILILACINFMNLSTARYTTRTKEVGIRKVIGANRSKLIMQFFVETFLSAFIAYMIAMLLVEYTLPVFNELTYKNLNIDYSDYQLLLLMVSIIVITGFMAGIYPALFLSSFKPITVLSNMMNKRVKGIAFRKILVVFQFSISVVLIICTMVFNKQFGYINNKDLGFKPENLVNIHVGEYFNNNWPAIRNEILQNPNIVSVTKDASLPVFISDPITSCKWEGQTEQQQVDIYAYNVGTDYFKTFGMQIVEGRSFSSELKTDSSNYILNEEAVRLMGIKDPIGKSFQIGKRKGHIIGLVKDFHQTSLHSGIQPLVLGMWGTGYNMTVQFRPGQAGSTVEFLENIWKKYGPGNPAEIDLMSDWVNELYWEDQREQKLVRFFSILAIIISCLGLFGLASFMAENRTKEVGIRKVNGASTLSIVYLLMKDFLVWVIYSFIIACPIAYIIMNRWLQNYVYRISLTIDIFLLSGIIAIFIAALTVAYQAYKAALKIPIEAIKYE